jgi:hypothetical protein
LGIGIFFDSEGLMFQAESYREPRLHFFLSKELSLDLSKEYLVKIGQLKPEEVSEELIQKFP